MAHSRCVPCRARVWREGPSSDHLADLCPGCGGALQPVSDLAELVGLRCLRARRRGRRESSPAQFEQISAHIREQHAERQRQRDLEPA